MKSPIDKWRVFVAIELPDDVRRRLINHVARLRQAIPGARASWSREESLHLTLKFLGDVQLENVDGLSRATERAAKAVGPFEIFIANCGSFPPRGQPRVLWIGIDDPSGKLGNLQQMLANECTKEGFPREQRAFHPHLTLARIRKPQGSRQLAALHQDIEFSRERVEVGEIAVIRSELLSEGSKHTVISCHVLAQTTT